MRLLPLVVATMASQGLLVVLSPTIVAVGLDLGAPVGVVGQARSITAVVAIAVSVVIAGRIDVIGVPRLLSLGAGLAVLSSGVVAISPVTAAFLGAHVLVGIAFALLLSGGFAGVAAFAPERRAWAVGYVAGANALAWIVVNPIVSFLTDRFSWRLAQVVPATLAGLALLGARYAPISARGQVVPGLRELFAGGSARLWIGSELIAYGAWTSVLTFSGAFFIEVAGVAQAGVGWFLAAGAAAYFLASTRSGSLSAFPHRRRLIAGSAVVMAGLVAAMLNVSGPILALGLFCGVGFAAGIRTPASSALGLEQLPEHPGAMMAARTAATQLGYMAGALVGGVVIQAASYDLLGFVLAGGMVLSAWLVLRVEDPADVDPASIQADDQGRGKGGR